jgi:Ser-tRNA(Ala) deacylase AlaX
MAKDYFAPMHSAEHILNQTMVRTYNCGRSFSNHIEKKKSKCDYHFYRDLSELEREMLETNVNKIIRQNLEVTQRYMSIDKASRNFNLGKLPENTGKEIRIIDIGDFDTCPCIGVHVSNTSEIGQFKIISSSFDNNILRIRFKLI